MAAAATLSYMLRTAGKLALLQGSFAGVVATHLGALIAEAIAISPSGRRDRMARPPAEQ